MQRSDTSIRIDNDTAFIRCFLRLLWAYYEGVMGDTGHFLASNTLTLDGTILYPKHYLSSGIPTLQLGPQSLIYSTLPDVQSDTVHTGILLQFV